MSPTSVSAKLSRRRVLGALAALPLAGQLPAHADESGPIRIAQSIALSGPLGELGQAMHQGAKACFAAVNTKGGVHGRAIELTVADDGYDVKRALANVNGFMEDRGNFALFNCMGTPMIEAMLPHVIESDMPFFAPFSGALSVRPKNVRTVFNIRASYADEAEQLVQHLATIGIKRIAIAYQNNSFGKEVFTATQQAMAKHKLEAIMVATVENNSSDAAAAAKKIAQSEPEAVLVGLAGKPTIDFVKASRLERKGMPPCPSWALRPPSRPWERTPPAWPSRKSCRCPATWSCPWCATFNRPGRPRRCHWSHRTWRWRATSTPGSLPKPCAAPDATPHAAVSSTAPGPSRTWTWAASA